MEKKKTKKKTKKTAIATHDKKQEREHCLNLLREYCQKQNLTILAESIKGAAELQDENLKGYTVLTEKGWIVNISDSVPTSNEKIRRILLFISIIHRYLPTLK